MKIVTMNDISGMSFQPYRKDMLAKARQLTKADYKEMHGQLQTREGLAAFKPGDYLATTPGRVWVVSKKFMQQNYISLSGPDEDGFTTYRAHNIRQARQMHEPFMVHQQKGNTFHGQAGDYLIHDEHELWIVDRESFETGYIPISSDK